MALDCKKYFLGESGVLDCRLDLSETEWNGVNPFPSPITARVELKGGAGSVALTAQVRYTVSMNCDRCGKMTVREYDRVFSHILVRRLENEEDDDNYVVLPDERLDLDGLLREDILLDLPSKYLCSPHCKGLCPKCGKDLNEGPCGCEEGEIDPRLEILKSLL